ncbi:MAG: hypothetical protein AB9873_10300 [Syntrophobacteraceae bacterium]
MNRWITYVLERFPLVGYLLVAGGLCGSTTALLRGRNWTYEDLLATSLASAGVLLFLIQLRWMDEVKDVDKDRLAHPERPLPRGLVSFPEVVRVIRGFNVAAVVFAAVLAGLGYLLGASTYLALWGFLLLMYKEFFAGKWLGERPILYALSHQASLVLIAMFSASLLAPDRVLSAEVLAVGFMNMGAFLTYEVARKLDPKAHPVLKNYLGVYGASRTIALLASLQALTVAFATFLGIVLLVGPCAVLVSVSLVLVRLRPQRFKTVELIASVAFLIEIWSPLLVRFLL